MEAATLVATLVLPLTLGVGYPLVLRAAAWLGGKGTRLPSVTYLYFAKFNLISFEKSQFNF